MKADRAYLGRGHSDRDMSAVAAFPDLDLAFFKDGRAVHITKELAVALLVMLFDLRDKSEFRRKSAKAFPFRRLRKRCVHIGPLVILAFRRVQKIIRRIPETAELLKPQLRVLLLVVGRLEEDRGDLLVSFDMDAIKAAGYDVTTPLIVTNTDDYEEVKMLAEGTVNNGSEVLEVK